MHERGAGKGSAQTLFVLDDSLLNSHIELVQERQQIDSRFPMKSQFMDKVGTISVDCYKKLKPFNAE